MEPWSKDSWAQWMPPSREPLRSPSVRGVRPAVKSMGVLERLALMMPLVAFAVPGMVCTMTTCGLPVTIV